MVSRRRPTNAVAAAFVLACASAFADGLRIEPLFDTALTNGSHVFLTAAQKMFPDYRAFPQTESFRAVVTRSWVAGLIPVFEKEQNGEHLLSRLPPTGQEHLVEPIFFALPPSDDPSVRAIVGRWQINATNSDGSSRQFAWELTAQGEKIVGRFDPDTDYRFALINSGRWKTNTIELRVTYVGEEYRVHGQLDDQTLSGVWKQVDGDQQGTWTGRRGDAPPLPISENLAARNLYKWRLPTTTTVRYGVKAPDEEKGWLRGEVICQVWVRRSQTAN